MANVWYFPDLHHHSHPPRVPASHSQLRTTVDLLAHLLCDGSTHLHVSSVRGQLPRRKPWVIMMPTFMSLVAWQQWGCRYGTFTTVTDGNVSIKTALWCSRNLIPLVVPEAVNMTHDATITDDKVVINTTLRFQFGDHQHKHSTFHKTFFSPWLMALLFWFSFKFGRSDCNKDVHVTALMLSWYVQ